MTREIEESLGQFIETRRKLTEVISGFPVESRGEVIFDRWSLKDVVAHLANWMAHDIDCLLKLKQRVEPDWEPSVDEFNRRGVEKRRTWNWSEVFLEFESLGDELEEIYKTLPNDLWDVPIWKGHSETARKFLQEDIDHWRNEHLGELKKRLKTISSAVPR